MSVPIPSQQHPTILTKPSTVPGEYEVAHLTDVIHLNTIETITGISGHADKASSFVGMGSSASASATVQTISTFWRGHLFLSNYALSFMVMEGPGTTTATKETKTQPHPNSDIANASLLHVPVGAVWKMEYGKYAGGTTGITKEDRAKEKAEKQAEKGDYSGFSGASLAAAAAATTSSTDSDLRDISYQLTLYCRDARVLSFGILRKASQPSSSVINASHNVSSAQAIEDRAVVAAEFARLLKKYAFPKEVKKLFAFSYMGGSSKLTSGTRNEGWGLYDVEREFFRMGIGGHPADETLGTSMIHPRRRCRWRLDTTNSKFEFSPTYPQSFWVPMDITDKELGKVKSFRSKGRLPALVYNYSDLLDYEGLGLNSLTYPDTVILRSAQPNIGWTFGRCQADERLLELAEVRVIIDARPYANAVANQAKGGGYENAENYKDCKIEFMNIENIHVMRDALNKMLEALKLNHVNAYNTGVSTQIGDDFWGHMQQSGWLKHVRILLEGALVCANYIKQGVSILIHCSDGWDRTSQLTSLAQIILDPFYRTRHGFGILVEKEWVSFGHQFQKRCGHGQKDHHHGDERSPIFVQFLDATWQLQQQFPFAFEFNSEYLGAIADHLYSNKFGTFLGDNEHARMVDRVRECTQSVWSEVNNETNRRRFENHLYGQGGVAISQHLGVWGDRSANQLSQSAAMTGLLPPNNPSMNLHNLNGAELGKAAFLHVSADPRKIGIWSYWYRWERRKAHHAPSHIYDVSGAPQPSHLHHTATAQLISHTRAAVVQEKARSAAREQVMLESLTALEQDVVRMDAQLKAQAEELNALRAAKGEPAQTIPTTFRHSTPWKNDLLVHPTTTVHHNGVPQLNHAMTVPVTHHPASSSSTSSSSHHPPPPPPSRLAPPPIPLPQSTNSSSNSQSHQPDLSPSASVSSSQHKLPHPTDLSSSESSSEDEGTDQIEDEWSGIQLRAGRESIVDNPLMNGQEPDFDADDLSMNAVDARKRSIMIQQRLSIAQAAHKQRESMMISAHQLPPPPIPAALAHLQPPPFTQHKCLYAFTATAAGQVSMSKGDIVDVYEQGKLGWWKIKNLAGEVGMAPANRIEQTEYKENAATAATTAVPTPTHASNSTPPVIATTSAPTKVIPTPASPSNATSTTTPPSLPTVPSTTSSSSSTPVTSSPSSPRGPNPPIGVVGGPPQFRVNANIFSGIKLKPTQKRPSTLKREKEKANETTSNGGGGDNNTNGGGHDVELTTTSPGLSSNGSSSSLLTAVTQDADTPDTLESTPVGASVAPLSPSSSSSAAKPPPMFSRKLPPPPPPPRVSVTQP